jgi:hypothetical protein
VLRLVHHGGICKIKKVTNLATLLVLRYGRKERELTSQARQDGRILFWLPYYDPAVYFTRPIKARVGYYFKCGGVIGVKNDIILPMYFFAAVPVCDPNGIVGEFIPAFIFSFPVCLNFKCSILIEINVNFRVIFSICDPMPYQIMRWGEKCNHHEHNKRINLIFHTKNC